MPLRIVALVSIAALSASHLTATSVTFGTFSEGTDDFFFTNNGNGTGTFTATSTVQFTFYNDVPAADLLLGPLPTTPITATLTRAGTVSAAANCTAPCTPGSIVTQALTESSLTITNNANGDILLQSVGDGATLTGQIGGSVLSLQNSSPPNTLTFTSDYINFAGAIATGRSVSFSSVDPGVTIAGDGLLNDFSAAGTGTFSSTFAPEPDSLSLTLLGLLPLALLVRRGRSGSVIAPSGSSRQSLSGKPRG